MLSRSQCGKKWYFRADKVDEYRQQWTEMQFPGLSARAPAYAATTDHMSACALGFLSALNAGYRAALFWFQTSFSGPGTYQPALIRTCRGDNPRVTIRETSQSLGIHRYRQRDS